MTRSVLGTRVIRTEDPGLLTGHARYLNDLDIPGKLHAVFVRSEVAHARLGFVHVESAQAIAGVTAVFTAATLGVASHHGIVKVHDDFIRPALATDTVRFVGEPIALVVAESVAAACDAAAAVWADYEHLDAIVDPEQALDPATRPIFLGHSDNVAVMAVDPRLDLEGVSDIVVRGRYVNQRIAAVPMETNGCAAIPDDGHLTFYASTQMPHGLRNQLSRVLGMDRDLIRVVCPQVGGGFGAKAGLCAEYAAIACAAIRLGQPLTWSATRNEDLLSLPHGRAQIQYAELGLTRDGSFTGLRVRLIGDAGAYPTVGAILPAGTRRMAQGNYRMPAMQFDIAVAVTNTAPVGAYRGAGRPEATALIERLVDQAARELELDPLELRRRNMLSDDVFPFTTLSGVVYDSGRYLVPLAAAAEAIDYVGLRAEQQRRRRSNSPMALGIGVAAYVEITAGGGGSEFGAVEVEVDGSVIVRAGTLAHGQGHQTSYAMIVSELTGIDVDRIRLIDGDTDQVPRGSGTGGSRSLQLGGSAVYRATEQMVDRARRLAAQVLEASHEDIVLDTTVGGFLVRGVPAQVIQWNELARGSDEVRPESIGITDGEPILRGIADFAQDGATFPFGCHICAVEVDVQTGRATVIRHVAVDDCGVVVSPLLVQGQQHGGIASGIGQALFEEIVYDEAGNLQTSTLAEYGMPSAAEMPSFITHSTETPSPLNPMGVKGIGEAATIGSTPAIQNAIIDAVAHLGVRHIDMPCTAERIWRSIREASHDDSADPWRPPPAFFTDRAGPTVISDEAIRAAEAM